jgi:NADP-dependent 3-hydroxy acid dehydrogenase YdfG
MGESFEGRKVVVVGGGSSGMGPAMAHQVVAGGGIAVITGRDQDRVRAAVETLSHPRRRSASATRPFLSAPPRATWETTRGLWH